ncbi:MAG: NUDIX hydrolase [Trebonia sp.]
MRPQDNGTLRSAIAGLVAGVRPLDDREAADQARTLAWIASGEQLFRTVPPDTPPKHLVSYFVPFDEANRRVLLGDHRKSGLWLPPGGHVEPGEDPRDTVTREALEELDLQARFHAASQPLFLTVTATRGTPSHTEVSLWFVLDAGDTGDLRPDPREYRGIGWFGLDEHEDWLAGDYDPEMHRFARKLSAALKPLRDVFFDVLERPEEALSLDQFVADPADGLDRVMTDVEQVSLPTAGSADGPGLRLGHMEADDWLQSAHRILSFDSSGGN